MSSYTSIGIYDLNNENLGTIVQNINHTYPAGTYEVGDSMGYLSMQQVQYNSGTMLWEPVVGTSPISITAFTASTITQQGFTQATSTSVTPPSSQTPGYTTPTTTNLDVYDLSYNQAGSHAAGKYALEEVTDNYGATTGYRLIPVEPDMTTTAVMDDYIAATTGTPIDITSSDWTNAGLTDTSSVGTYTIYVSGSGSGGVSGGGSGGAMSLAGSEKFQINMANSTGAASALIDAAEGLDSLHLDGLAFFSDSGEDLTVDQNDKMITSDMLADTGSGIFQNGSHYAEINLGSTLSGEVHVWTQTPEYFNGNMQFDTVLGVVDNSTSKLIEANDNGNPNGDNFSSSEITGLISANSSTRSSSTDSYLSFNAINDGRTYSIIVGDKNDYGYGEFGGAFDLYVVSDISSTETLLLSETNLSATSGAFVDFSGGISGELQSAWVTSLGSTGNATSFTIDNFESLELTQFADYVYVTSDVGHGVGKAMHSANYFSTEQSGMIIDPGKSSGGVDKLSVHSDSLIYLSYLDSSDMSNNGIAVTINNNSAAVSGTDINTVVEKMDGTGLLIDYLETTSYADDVVNSGDKGMVVNLGGNWSSSSNDTFTGSSNSSAVDVLDARMANSLEFGTNGDWVSVSGYNEIRPKSEKIYDLTSEHGVYPGMYTIREGNGFYYANQVSGDGGSNPYYVSDYTDMLTTLDSTSFAQLVSVKSIQHNAVVTDAHLKNVDYIMVRDETLAVQGNDDEQIWQSLNNADVDFYVDMSDIYSPDAQLISGLGAGTLDTFGKGYDVETSAQVDNFDGSPKRVYYDGDHRDFKDEEERIDTDTPGFWEMEQGVAANGASWANEVSANTSGGGGSFFIVVSGKKIAVKHSNDGWVVDNTSLSIAQGVDRGTADETIFVDYDGRTESNFIKYVADRYGLSDAMSDADDYEFSNAIYLNATEQQITEILGGSGSITSEKAFNFGFYTKVTIGGNTVNLKITQDDEVATLFKLDIDDIDLMVESLYNTVQKSGESIDSGSAAGNFVKIDNEADIAMGNGGDDTYVIAGENGGGDVLEYGNINVAQGGLSNSLADSINFANIDEIGDLQLARGKVKNEKTDSSLLVNKIGDTTKTVVFDNFNEYIDFRRVEFLTIDDASNNNEIFEISVGDNSGSDGSGRDLAWDNEIVVADNLGETIYADGGTDILVGGDGNDVFNLDNVVASNDHNTMSHVHIKNLDTGDSIDMDTTDNYISDDKDDGILTIRKTDGTEYMLFADDESLLKNYIDVALAV